MIRLSSNFRNCLRGTLLGLLVSAPFAAHSADDSDTYLVVPGDTVLMWGDSTESEKLGFDFNGESRQISEKDACRAVHGFLSRHAMGMFSMLDSLGDAGAGITEGLGDAESRLRECMDNPGPSSDFWLIYTECSMTMGNGTQWMRWTTPPASPEATMTALDFARNEAAFVTLETRLEQVEAAGVGSGDLRGYTMSGPGGKKNVSVYIPELTEFDAFEYDYGYDGEIAAAGGAEAGFLAQVGKISSTGKAWIAPDAPGADIFAAFYRNFRERVQPATGMGSMLSGMVRQMAQIANRGIPIENTVTIKGGMGLASMAGGGQAGSINTSSSTINAILVESGSTYCGLTVIPEGMAVTDLDAMMPGGSPRGTSAAASAGGADDTSTPASEEPEKPPGCDCSCGAFKKLQNMSEADKKKMQSSPEGMAIAMCAAQCMSNWMSCGR